MESPGLAPGFFVARPTNCPKGSCLATVDEAGFGPPFPAAFLLSRLGPLRRGFFVLACGSKWPRRPLPEVWARADAAGSPVGA